MTFFALFPSDDAQFALSGPSFAFQPLPPRDFSQIVRRQMARSVRHIQIEFPSGSIVKFRVDEMAWHDPEIRARAAEEMILHLFSRIDEIKSDVDEVRAVVYRVLDMNPETFTASVSAPRVSRPRRRRSVKSTTPDDTEQASPADATPLDANHLAFAKWLVDHGILTEFPPEPVYTAPIVAPHAADHRPPTLWDASYDTQPATPTSTTTATTAPDAASHIAEPDAL